MTTATIKAIETRYKGYRFRSRLEARWAVFFDTLGVKWEYEPQGFDLGDGIAYLPDFWLDMPYAGPPGRYESATPQRPGCWVEIKPDALTDVEEDKCRRLAAQTRHVVYALSGGFGAETFISSKWHFKGGEWLHRERYDIAEEPWFADWYGDSFLFHLCREAHTDDRFWGRKELDPAFTAGRSARFEHGERG